MKETTTTTIITHGWDRQYEHIYFYNNNEIVLAIESSALQPYTISEKGLFNEAGTYTLEMQSINITAPRRANKLNLNRKDNFYFKNLENTYGIEKYYDLYIYCGAGGDAVITPDGEKLCSEYDGEKHFKNAYKVLFLHGCNVKRWIREKYPMENPENYQLQPGEIIERYKFGTKEAPCVWTYDTSESLFLKKQPGFVPEKGVIKSYIIYETLFNELLTAPRCYTRYEKSPERQAADDLLNTINEKTGLKLSQYDFKKLLAVANVSLK